MGKHTSYVVFSLICLGLIEAKKRIICFSGMAHVTFTPLVIFIAFLVFALKNRPYIISGQFN